MTTHDTVELLRAVRGGDRNALDELMRRHLAALRAFVRAHGDRVIRDRESCSDLVQTACRQVLEQLDRFEWRGEGSFRRWLFTLAMNKIRNRHAHHLAARRDVRREHHADQVGTDDCNEANAFCYATLVTPSHCASVAEQMQRVERTLDMLHPEQKSVIVWHRFAGLSHREIAEELGRSETSVRTLLSRGMARFAKLWHESGGAVHE